VEEQVGTDKRKQSLYFPEDMLDEIQHEAERQDRSLSWIMQQAWRLARPNVGRLPGAPKVLEFPEKKASEEAKSFVQGKFDRT
jgi:uncharacterized small protein (TIGR04563 family)